MECVELDPPRAIAFVVHDGPVEMHGRITIQPEGPTGSRFTISVDIPGMTNPLDPLPVSESARRIKELVEAER